MNLSAESSPRVKPRSTASWLRATRWFSSGLIAAPLTIVIHEFGHFLAGLAFNHPRIAFHYASVSSGATEAAYPPWQLATVAAAGPLVTCATVIVCCYLVGRYRSHPLLVAAGLFAPLKFSVGFVFVCYWLSGARDSSPNFDEFNVAKHADISPFIPILIGALVLVGGWFWLIRGIPRNNCILDLATSIVGGAIGLTLYLTVIGPRLLP